MLNRAVPDPAAVSHGVWSVGLPFPNPLGFAFSYSVRVPDGVVAVDIGWDSDECWDAFVKGLSRAGACLDDMVGIVVTHVHPDHYGLAERIRESTGRGSLCTPPKGHRSPPSSTIVRSTLSAWRSGFDAAGRRNRSSRNCAQTELWLPAEPSSDQASMTAGSSADVT